MNDPNNADNETIEYHTHCTGTELDDDGYYCTESTEIEQDFAGDINDYENLSLNAPKVTDWKSEDESIVNLQFNTAAEEMHGQLNNEISHITRKIVDACGKAKVSFEDLVQLKYGKDSELMKTFMNSDIKMFKNNHDKCTQFFGTFVFCSLIRFSAGDALKDKSINTMLMLDIKSKLMSHDDYVKV